MNVFSRAINYKPYQITSRQMISLVAISTTPGKVSLLELGALPLSCLVTWPRKGQYWRGQMGSQALPVLSLPVLLAFCDWSRHRTLALIDITDAYPLPIDRLLPRGHLSISTRDNQDVGCVIPAHVPHNICELVQSFGGPCIAQGIVTGPNECTTILRAARDSAGG